MFTFLLSIGAAGADGFDGFRARVAHADVRTVEAALPLVSPVLRTNFALMRRSASSQGASDEFPRVLLFGEDARFLIGFNACPAHVGHDSLEMIQYRDATDSFEFRRMTFDGSNRPRVSAPNPRACARCHGVDPRPIWAPYPQWANEEHAAYGGKDDIISLQEEPGYARFRARADADPRYRVLLGDRAKPNWPFWSGVRPLPNHERPNMRLGQALNVLNGRWLARRMRRRESVGLTYILLREHGWNKNAFDLATEFYPEFHHDATKGNSFTTAFLTFLMEKIGYGYLHWSLEIPRPKHLHHQGLWDGEQMTDDLVLRELATWAFGATDPAEIASFRPDANRRSTWITPRVPELRARLARARCQELLESPAPASYGSPSQIQEKTRGVTRSL